MNEMQVFNNNEFGNIRTLLIENEPYFMLNDVCRILEIGNPSDVKNRLKKDGVDIIEVIDELGRTQKANFITESNLYKVIFQSRKPQAEKFTDWVTDEVLPSIRKTGSYSHTPKTYLEALEQLVEKVKQNEILALENKAKDQQIAELKPKATYYDFILQCKDAVSISKISKDYGMSAIAMNRLLNELGVQYKQGDMWLLYAKYQDKGYTQSKTHNYDKGDGTQGVAMSTYWTQKGRLFIYDLLKNSGVTPLIERDAVCA